MFFLNCELLEHLCCFITTKKKLLANVKISQTQGQKFTGTLTENVEKWVMKIDK